MNSVRHRSHGQPKTRLPHPSDTEAALLELPEAQPIIRRIAANVDPDYPARLQHIAHIAAVAVNAKRHPSNAYAQPTL